MRNRDAQGSPVKMLAAVPCKVCVSPFDCQQAPASMHVPLALLRLPQQVDAPEVVNVEPDDAADEAAPLGGS